MSCNQCQMLNINGLNCHETGCPNDRSWQCFECGSEYSTKEEVNGCCDLDCETEHVVRVVKATSRKDARRIGIHLLNPDTQELDDARETAHRDLFTTIYVHTKRTWPKGESK